MSYFPMPEYVPAEDRRGKVKFIDGILTDQRSKEE